jgi:23S rRNA (pseudouridine1915-N3)-methyltransferase
VKLALVAVGKLKEAWVQEGCAEYAKRVRGKLPLDLVEVKDDAELVRKIPPKDYGRYKLWALDERGKELSSEELAASLKQAMNGGEQGIALVIGGADGLPRDLVARANFTWSLGRLTLPHRLARLIVLEQLYRALSILRGEPYHRP